MFSFRTLLRSRAAVILACALILPFVSAEAEEALSREIWKAGDMTVTVIQDLPGEMSAAIFSGPASEKERLKYFTDGKAEAGVHVFMLRTNDKVALFDAGAGSVMKSPGKLPQTLTSLGIKPEDVDFVLPTHMHRDHIGGLLREEKRAFPRAKVLVSKPELESWLALAKTSNAGAALVKSVVAAYGADIQTFAFGDTLLPGVAALDASGHTPGHTVFQLAADGKNLLILGDLIHSMPLQFALPDECAAYDMDPPKAISARKRIFDLAEREGVEIAGIHFPFGKSVGMLKKDGKGWKLSAVGH